MKCPECDSELIKNDGQGACLVAHQDNLEYTADGKLHDHATPCDYGGGIHHTCKKGHKYAVPTINKCWCGHEEKATDGGFDKEYIRLLTVTMPWQESVDYWGRRIRETPRWDYISTRIDGFTTDMNTMDMHGYFVLDVYTSEGEVIPPIMDGAELINPIIQ